MIRGMILLLLAACSGCVGTGEGWLAGSLWIDSCNEGEPLAQKGDFSLDVDFFAGETLEDPNLAISQRRNRLTVRIQVTSNNIEESDGLIFQFLDTAAVARAFVEKTPVPVTNRVTCSGASCPAEEDLLRARLHLFTRCPDCRQPLVGSSAELGPGPGTTSSGQPCQRPTGQDRAACATLTSEGRAALDALCAGSFADPSVGATISTYLGIGASCVYLCRFGQAASGQDLAGFAIRYGDPVAALYSVRIVDGRALEAGTCAVAEGQLTGMVSFDVRRGQSGQAFP
jgi:hypothetical protein